MKYFVERTLSKNMIRQLKQVVRDYNILPFLSACNVECIFCSNKQNPAGVPVWFLPPLPVDKVVDIATLLDPVRPIVIGEAVSFFLEGEPFLHPRWQDILRQLRQLYPQTPLRITTNGSLLDEEAVAFLAHLGGITIILSLNSADPRNRALLMGEREDKARRAVEAVRLLAAAGVPFEGSVVAMPHLVGWDDLANTLHYLAEQGALLIRVFIPGYTKCTPLEIVPPAAFISRLPCFIEEMRRRLSVPVVLEPPELCDLQPVVAGVLRNSPAARAGIKAGDLILAVDGVKPRSRYEAFHLVRAAASPRLRLWRPLNNRKAAGEPATGTVRVNKAGKEGVVWEVSLDKPADAPSGLVMDRDLDPALIERLVRQIRKQRARRVSLLTGELAAPLFTVGLATLAPGIAERVEVIAVKNRFFGGNIRAATLLTRADIEAALVDRHRYGSQPDLILLPPVLLPLREENGCPN